MDEKLDQVKKLNRISKILTFIISGVWIIGGIIVFKLYTLSDLQMSFNVIKDLIINSSKGKLSLDVILIALIILDFIILCTQTNKLKSTWKKFMIIELIVKTLILFYVVRGYILSFWYMNGFVFEAYNL